MNQKNHGYLAGNLRDAGFPEVVIQKLPEMLKKKLPDFSIEYQPDFGNDAVFAILHFKNWKETDLYYFNRYHLILSRKKPEDCIQQVFYCGKKDPVIDLVKAYNLLCGRSVYRQRLISHLNEEYSSWVQLDFQETDSQGNFRFQYFHHGYGFNLRTVLKSFPFRELDDPSSLEMLIDSLEQGNRCPVSVCLGEKIETFHVEALPQFRSLKIFDPEGRKLTGKALMLMVTLSQRSEKADLESDNNEGQPGVGARTDKKEKVLRKRIRA